MDLLVAILQSVANPRIKAVSGPTIPRAAAGVMLLMPNPKRQFLTWHRIHKLNTLD